MKNLNHYITEAWSGVKQQVIKSDTEAWCEEMGIKNYTINSQGEIDVNGSVWLANKDFKELPYKFGYVSKSFSLRECKNLISLKNCPNEVCNSFDLDGCSQLESLEGCPKEVGGYFCCRECKREFAVEEVISLCKVKRGIYKRL